MKKTVVKELVSVIISLLSTILALLAVSILDGIVNIAVGLDSTITTCCLLAIATPVRGSTNSQGCLSKLYTCIFCQKRKRRLSIARAQLELPTMYLEYAHPVKELPPKQLKAENQISPSNENSLSIPQYNTEGNSKSQRKRISVILQLQNIDDEDQSTYSAESSSSRSTKHQCMNSLSVETMKKYDECNKVYDDKPGAEV